MVQKRITELLDALNDELERTDELDAATRAQIEAAAADLDALLARDEQLGRDDASATLRERLLEFEIEHPRIAAILGEAAELLSRLGV